MSEKPEDETEYHYVGEELVPADSFLRRIPNALTAEQRIRLDAICFSADALTNSWLTLRDIAAQVGPEINRITPRLRAAAFNAAWSIVDHLHNVRQLLASWGSAETGPVTARLLDALRPAQVLRNKMDHLSSNLRNLAGREGSQSALFGSLSYFLMGEPPVANGYSIVIQAGLLHGKQAWNIVNPAGRVVSPPADLFELSAFGMAFQLGPPIAQLGHWLSSSVPLFEADLLTQLQKVASRGEYTLEKLMEHSGSGYSIALAVTAKPSLDSPDQTAVRFSSPATFSNPSDEPS